jgi:hypothetical protein
MKVLVDISDELFNRIKGVNKDSSLSNFIIVAIENQISLEKEQSFHLNEPQIIPQRTPQISDKKRSENSQDKRGKIQVEILNNPISYEKIKPIPLKSPIKTNYIWGQYNKFFTIKFALRYLAFMQSKNMFAPVQLKEFQEKCGKQAAIMKKILNDSDQKADRKRGMAFSAGLPDVEEKSQSRFINHFIGYLDSEGKPVGALSDLGFIVIENNEIALSPFGLEFASKKNPVLDTDPYSPDLFSHEERQFLINHIQSNIPTEWQGMKTVIQWIESGINTPDLLNAKFLSLDSEWTEKMANTYRTGMLARMYDLGFISRKKIGINANYEVTEFGKKVVGIT